MSKIKILVACGSGIATSTLAVSVVEELCKDNNIPADIIKSSMHEIESYASSVDVILTTNKFSKELGVPIVNVVAFISGINEEKVKEDVKNLLIKLVEEKRGN